MPPFCLRSESGPPDYSFNASASLGRDISESVSGTAKYKSSLYVDTRHGYTGTWRVIISGESRPLFGNVRLRISVNLAN